MPVAAPVENPQEVFIFLPKFHPSPSLLLLLLLSFFFSPLLFLLINSVMELDSFAIYSGNKETTLPGLQIT